MVGLVKSLFEIKGLILIASLILAIVSSTFIIGDKDLITAQTFSNQLSYMASINSGKNIQIQINNEKEFEVASNSNNEIIVKSTEKDLSVTKNYVGDSKVSQNTNSVIIEG
jgi:hypothetical protein